MYNSPDVHNTPLDKDLERWKQGHKQQDQIHYKRQGSNSFWKVALSSLGSHVRGWFRAFSSYWNLVFVVDQRAETLNEREGNAHLFCAIEWAWKDFVTFWVIKKCLETFQIKANISQSIRHLNLPTISAKFTSKKIPSILEWICSLLLLLFVCYLSSMSFISLVLEIPFILLWKLTVLSSSINPFPLAFPVV